jgi:Ca-activated chloride channel family protein
MNAAIRRLAPLAALGVAASSFLHAQDFRSTADAVLVPVTVTDRNGRFVRGLTVDQFEIRDDGARRPITQFSAERVPVSLGILLDVSGSMASDPKAKAAEDARWTDTRRALELLLSRLDARDEIFFAVFHDQVALAAPWTLEHDAVLRAFDRIAPGGRTALFNAVARIAPAFELARYQRRALLVISDGNDSRVPTISGARPIPTYPATPEQQHLARLFFQREAHRTGAVGETKRVIEKSGAAVFAVGMGTRQGAPVSLDNLEALTRGSGGYTEPLKDPAEISAAVARIADDLQSQYVLGFEPTKADGEFHPIAVEVKGRGLTVRARAGYVASGRVPQ